MIKPIFSPRNRSVLSYDSATKEVVFKSGEIELKRIKYDIKSDLDLKEFKDNLPIETTNELVEMAKKLHKL